jgi:signal transduction histidine kinase
MIILVEKLQSNLRRYSNDPLAVLAMPVSLLLHIAAAVQYHRGYVLSGQEWILQEFFWHFQILLIISAVLSLLLVVLPKSVLLLLTFKAGLFYLLAYPFGLEFGVVLVLLLALLTEIVAFLSIKPAIVYLFFTLCIAASLSTSGSVFNLPRRSADFNLALTFAIVVLLYLTTLLLYKRATGMLLTANRKTSHLNSVISQLSDANLDFQRYVHSVEYSAVRSERRRISSEIHDTVGYSLTNILMTLEAVTDLIGKDIGRARDALDRSITEAQTCLEETRRSMQELRSKELKEAVGLQAIAHLARSFSEATGMKVQIEYGNAPNSFGRGLDLILFRIIQEGLTNSFRHGQADMVRITLWIEKGYLFLTILDNGQSTSKIVEGIGISGMRERVEQIGGTISFHNYTDGFKVRTVLPLTDDADG